MKLDNESVREELHLDADQRADLSSSIHIFILCLILLLLYNVHIFILCIVTIYLDCPFVSHVVGVDRGFFDACLVK